MGCQIFLANDELWSILRHVVWLQKLSKFVNLRRFEAVRSTLNSSFLKMPVKRRTKANFKSYLTPSQFRKRITRIYGGAPDLYGSERSSISNFSMDSTGETSTQTESTKGDKKRRLNEAQMIPGLIPRKVYGFPDTIITTMRYCDAFTRTSTLGAIGFNTFRANSIFDPDETGLGHQPMYRDQWAGIYNSYVVIGSKITVRFARQSTANLCVGVCGDDNSLFPTLLSEKMEMNNSVYTILHADDVTLQMTYEPQQNFGVDAKSDGASQTAVGSNPAEQYYFGVWGHCIDATLTSKFDFTIEIEYTVKFSELITPIGS